MGCTWPFSFMQAIPSCQTNLVINQKMPWDWPAGEDQYFGWLSICGWSFLLTKHLGDSQVKIMVKALKNKPRPRVLSPTVWGGCAYPILADIIDKIFGVCIIKDSVCREKPSLPYQRPPSSGVCLCVAKGPSAAYLSEPSGPACLSFLCSSFGRESPTAPKSQCLDYLF